MKEIEKNTFELEKKDVQKIIPIRNSKSNKGTYGYVGIMGGCLNYSGSIKLANMSLAALRSGCGVSKVIVPKSIANSITPYLLEQTLETIQDENSYMLYNKEQIDRALKKLKALAIGMGWGNGKDNIKILEYILSKYEIPVVIDADGLNTLANMDLEILNKTKCKVILTPHYKEFERISKIPIQEIEKQPELLAKKFARKYNVILLLKGHVTIVTDGKTTYLVKRGCPGMATAGSGDVLSGVLVRTIRV